MGSTPPIANAGVIIGLNNLPIVAFVGVGIGLGG
jgi:hypothetical protein